MTFAPLPERALSPTQLVTDVATAWPATVRVFQRHHLEFCCGGKVPIADACAGAGLDLQLVLQELQDALRPSGHDYDGDPDLGSLVGHVIARYHAPARHELPRLHAMLSRVVERHGQQHAPALPLLRVFERLQRHLLAQMDHEEARLFSSLSSRGVPSDAEDEARTWLETSRAGHALTAAVLHDVEALTERFTPPAWACPTFRGLYHGLAELDADLQAHMRLELDVVFPRIRARVG